VIKIGKKNSNGKNNGVISKRMEESLSTISKGGAIALIGAMIGRGLGFINRALIAKFFGPAGLGVLALGLMWLTVFSRLSSGGFRSALKKFIPLHLNDNDEKMVNSTIFTIFSISLTISISGGAFLFLFSEFIAINIFDSEPLVPILKTIAILIPVQVLLKLITESFLAFKNTRYKVIFRDIGMQVLRLPMIIGIVLIGGTILNVAMVYVVSTILLIIASLIVFEKKVYPFLKKQKNSIDNLEFTPKRILNYSLPLLFSASLMIIMGKADTFMLGYFTTKEWVGIYNLILPIAAILTLFLISINQIFFPVISHLHAENNIEDLSETFSTVLRWDFMLTFPFFVFVVFFSKPLLSVFFEDYVAGWRALIILSIGMMFRSGLGPVGHTLETFGKTNFIFKINSILVLINIALNFFLIPIYGIEGAATATAVAYSLNNIIQMAKVRTLFDFEVNWNIYGKYLISSLIPVFIAYLILKYTFTNWWILIIIGIGFLISNFVLLLVNRGFKNEDRYLFKTIDIILEKFGLGKIKIEKIVEKRL